MTSGSILKLRQLGTQRRRLLLRAVVWLVIASLAVALLPFSKAIRLGSPSVGGRVTVSVEDVIWAVKTAGRRLPLRTLCIEEGLAVQRMLRAGGIDAILHYGARQDLHKLEAHVWVTVDGRTVIGGEQVREFAPLASFP